MFQSTRPCGARLPVCTVSHYRGCFNPRARAGRDHWFRASDANQFGVSIHAPVRGATDIDRVLRECLIRVSIHAPVRGATRWCSGPRVPLSCFNPRARAGRDAVNSPVVVDDASFQSTRPCGARPYVRRIFRYICRFNPRARAGRDVLVNRDALIGITFQSTRPCGARLYTCLSLNSSGVNHFFR